MAFAIVACTRSPPDAVKRVVSPNGKREITWWHEQAESTLDSNAYLTIAPVGADFNAKNIFAQVKRGREIEIYWSGDGRPVLSIRDFYGFVASKNGVQAFVLCGLPQLICRRLLPPSTSAQSIRIASFHTGESEPFAQ